LFALLSSFKELERTSSACKSDSGSLNGFEKTVGFLHAPLLVPGSNPKAGQVSVRNLGICADLGFSPDQLEPVA
jgi:hypothetical protein